MYRLSDMADVHFSELTPTKWAPRASDAVHRRVMAVAGLGVLNRLGDPVLERLTRLAVSLTGASAAAVHIFDDAYQHRVAAVNAPLTNHPADDSMCRLVVESGEPIITRDAVAEPRFSYTSFTKGDTPVRFYASLPLQVNGEQTVGTLCTFDTEARDLTPEQIDRLEDITELVRAHLTLLQIATDLGREACTDGLTRATTRVMFDHEVAQALAHQRTNGGEVLVVALDLDAFKAINDCHGHDRGDAALRWFVVGLRTAIGPDAIIGRLGGDEFGILCRLPDRSTGELLKQIGRAAAGFDPELGASMGATFAEPEDDVRSLMHRADQLMYADKVLRRGAEIRTPRSASPPGA
jgi:diguanylate cyclase (GGDEF)-like protein